MIPFNKPFMTGKELDYIARAHENGHLSGDGDFTKRCNSWLEQRLGVRRALLVHSCTAALEMAAILLDLKPGDEVIMPSYTFVSTANAFVLRGAVPVFVDVRPDTFNIDERLIEASITPKTRAICVVHYAGVACEMDTIMDIAERHDLKVVEDAAQALLSTYKGRMLGSIGDLAALSFHETKNIISGEGGALLINNREILDRAEVIREKGTNRREFFRGQVDKYTWVDIGSSYLPSELTAAFLMAQLDEADKITSRRLAIWDRYHAWGEVWEKAGVMTRPSIPSTGSHNAHMYYLVMRTLNERTRFIKEMKDRGVGTVFHYIPLHSSPAGRRFGRAASAELMHTDHVSDCLVRMPLWVGLEDRLDEVMSHADAVLGGIG